MSVTTVIDIDYYYFRYRKIEVEPRIVVPLGQNIVWRFQLREESALQLPPYLRLDIRIYFASKSPFRWASKNAQLTYEGRSSASTSLLLAIETANQEGDYKYGIEVGANNQKYDEDPFLIIRRL